MKSLISGLALFFLAATVHAACSIIAPVGSAITAQVNFSTPTKNTDGTTITAPLSYNIYQGTAPGAEVKVASGVSGTPITITTGLLPNTSYYWQVSVVESGVEGPLSNEACKGFAASAPGAVVITIT